MAIKFDGITVKNSVSYIHFINDAGERISVPIERVSAEQIKKYLAKFVVKEIKKEFRNIEE